MPLGYFSFPSYRSVRIDTIVVSNGQQHIAKGIPTGFFPPAGWIDMDTFDPCFHSLTGGSAVRTTYSSTLYSTASTMVDASLDVALMNKSGALFNTYQRYPLSLNSTCPLSIDNLDPALMNGQKFYQTYTRLDLGIGGLGGH